MKRASKPPTRLLELLAERRPSVLPLALALRELVAQTAPDAQELIYSNYAVVDVFSFTGKVSDAFCHIVSYDRHVNLGFNQGAELPDPKRLLVGTGKRIRHIRIESNGDLKLPLLSYLRAAVKNAKRPNEVRTRKKTGS